MIKKLILWVFIVASTSASGAGYEHLKQIKHLIIGEDVKFGIEGANASNTCDYYSRQFKFDPSTPKGKSLLGTILAAKLSEAPLSIWYQDSTTPGTVTGGGSTGCLQENMAVVTELGMP